GDDDLADLLRLFPEGEDRLGGGLDLREHLLDLLRGELRGGAAGLGGGGGGGGRFGCRRGRIGAAVDGGGDPVDQAAGALDQPELLVGALGDAVHRFLD